MNESHKWFQKVSWVSGWQIFIFAVVLMCRISGSLAANDRAESTTDAPYLTNEDALTAQANSQALTPGVAGNGKEATSP